MIHCSSNHHRSLNKSLFVFYAALAILVSTKNMSKNVLSDTSYRKLRVEDLDANAFHGDEEVEEVEGPNESRIKQLTQGGQHLELLRELIKNAPLKSNNQVSFV